MLAIESQKIEKIEIMENNSSASGINRDSKSSINDSGVIYIMVAVACLVVFLIIQSGVTTTMNSLASDLVDKMDSMSIASSESNTL